MITKFSKTSDVRVLYMGTPDISAKVLERLIAEGFDVVAAVCQEDKEVGRKHLLEPVPVKKVALEHGIPVFQPHRIRKEYSFLEGVEFDVLLTMAYGQIIPDEVLAMAKVGNVNLHGSLLPEYRGAAPIQRAIMDGKKLTGVTLMEMVSEMDAGDMYDVAEVEIAESDNYTSLREKIADAASSLAAKDLLKYANGELQGVKQDQSKVTFAEKITPEVEKLSLEMGKEDFVNAIRGMSEEPGAHLFLNERKIKIYEASVYSEETMGEIGTIVPDRKRFLLQLKDGVVELKRVQPEGKKKMDGASFLQGARLEAGAKLR